MVLAAQLGALATVNAGFLSTEPGFIDKARNGVFLYRKIGNPPGMNDVVRRNQQADFGANN